MSEHGNYLLQRIAQLEERVRRLEVERPTEPEIHAARPILWMRGQPVIAFNRWEGRVVGADHEGDPIVIYDGESVERPLFAKDVRPL